MAWSDEARKAAAEARAANGSHSQGVNDVGKSAESDKSFGLRMHGDNDSDIYRQSFMPVVSNLGQKMDQGKYDPDKATKLWGYHADRVAQSAAKENQRNGDDSRPWHQQFPPDVRKEAAANWEKSTRDEIARGNYGNPYPAHQTNLRAKWDAKQRG